MPVLVALDQLGIVVAVVGAEPADGEGLDPGLKLDRGGLPETPDVGRPLAHWKVFLGLRPRRAAARPLRGRRPSTSNEGVSGGKVVPRRTERLGSRGCSAGGHANALIQRGAMRNLCSQP